MPLDGSNVIVNGFSRESSDKYLPAETNDVLAEKIDSTTCEAMYAGVASGLQISDEYLFCSSTADPHRCHGNLGDPVVNEYGAQVGIVAGGSDCNTATHPTLNVRVSTFGGFLRAALCQASSFPPDTCPNELQANATTSNDSPAGEGSNISPAGEGNTTDKSPTLAPSSVSSGSIQSDVPSYQAATAMPTVGVLSFQPSSTEPHSGENVTQVEEGNATVVEEEMIRPGNEMANDEDDEGHVVVNSTMFNDTYVESVETNTIEFVVNGTLAEPITANVTEGLEQVNITADAAARLNNTVQDTLGTGSTGNSTVDAGAQESTDGQVFNGTEAQPHVNVTSGVDTNSTVEDALSSGTLHENNSTIGDLHETKAMNRTEFQVGATNSSTVNGATIASENDEFTPHDNITDVINGAKHQVMNATNQTVHSVSVESESPQNASDIGTMTNESVPANNAASEYDDPGTSSVVDGMEEANTSSTPSPTLVGTASPGPSSAAYEYSTTAAPTATVGENQGGATGSPTANMENMQQEATGSPTALAGETTPPTMEPSSTNLRGSMSETLSPTEAASVGYKNVVVSQVPTTGPATSTPTAVSKDNGATTAVPTQGSSSPEDDDDETEPTLLMKAVGAVGAVLPTGLLHSGSKTTEPIEVSSDPTPSPSGAPTPSPSPGSSISGDETTTTPTVETATTNSTAAVADDFSPLSGNDDLMAHMMDSIGLGWWNETKAWWDRNVGDKLADKCPAADDCELLGFNGSSYHLTVMGQCIPICDTTRSMQVIGFQCGECSDDDGATVTGNHTM